MKTYAVHGLLCLTGGNQDITFSEVETDFRNRVGSIVRKSLGSVSSSGSHETLKGSMSKHGRVINIISNCRCRGCFPCFLYIVQCSVISMMEALKVYYGVNFFCRFISIVM